MAAISHMHKQAFCSRRYLVCKAVGACTLMYRYELQHSGSVPVLHCEIAAILHSFPAFRPHLFYTLNIADADAAGGKFGGVQVTGKEYLSLLWV